MPDHLYLPRLDETANVGMPQRGGHWHGYERKVITAVADGIIVDEDAKKRGTSSVPDVWARALLFASAMRPVTEGGRVEHPLRAPLLREWRGLVSLLALRDVYKYSVDITPVPLLSTGDAIFDTALARLAPKDIQLEERLAYSWTTVVLIRYNQVPVGAFSPQTLVYTGVGYAPRLKGRGLPLTDPDGRLRPPDTPHDLAYVAKWIEGLQRALNDNVLWANNRNPHFGVVNTLNGLLADWLRDIQRDHGDGISRDSNASRVSLGEEVVASDAARGLFKTHRVYALVARPVHLEELEQATSQVAIQGTRNLSGHKQVLAITTSLLDRDPELWRGQRPSNLGRTTADAMKKFAGAASGHEIGSVDLRRDNVEWVRPDKYFLSDTLLRAAEGQAFVTAELDQANLSGRFLLPFRKEILDFFSPTEVITLLRPRYKDANGVITFQFTLPVALEPQLVERTYRKVPAGADEGTLMDVTVPVTEIFPVVRPSRSDTQLRSLDDHWRRYWLVHDQTDTLLVEPVVNGEAVSADARVRKDAKGRAARIVTTSADVRRLENGSCITPFPEALAFTALDKKPYGLLLLPIEPTSAGRSGKWRLGIDFGTSNTNVYRVDAVDTRSKAIQWAPNFSRFLCQVSKVQAERREAVLQDFLVPAREVRFPIPTALKLYDLTEQTWKELFLDFAIPFPRAGEFAPEMNVYTNIKWDADDQRKVEPFLRTLTTLLLVEAAAERVRTLEFVWSYPKAFSERTKQRYEAEWRQVFEKVLKASTSVMHIASVEDSAEDRMDFSADDAVVEGRAAGIFFTDDRTTPNQDDQANHQDGAVCLDVGGGTTDISIWHQYEIADDASILLAGGHVAECLAARPSLVKLLFSGGATGAASALLEYRDQPNKFSATLNLALKHEEGQIHQMLLRHTNHRDVQWLRRLLLVQFGAIAAYAATLVASLAKLDNSLKQDVSRAGMKLHWGGNAARLINWLDFGDYDPNGIGTKLLNAIFLNSLGDYDLSFDWRLVGQRQSPGPKSEVAGGLVVMKKGGAKLAATKATAGDNPFADAPAAGGEGPSRARRDVSRVVSGEVLTLTNGKTIQPEDAVSNDVLFAGETSLVQEVELVRFTRFVERVNGFAVRFGLFSSDDQIDFAAHGPAIATRVRTDFGRLARENVDRRVLEPPFIMATEALLRRLREE